MQATVSKRELKGREEGWGTWHFLFLFLLLCHDGIREFCVSPLPFTYFEEYTQTRPTYFFPTDKTAKKEEKKEKKRQKRVMMHFLPEKKKERERDRERVKLHPCTQKRWHIGAEGGGGKLFRASEVQIII